MDGHDAIELDAARTSGNVEQIEVLTPAVESLEGTNEQLVLAYWDWITVGNNNENKIKEQPEKMNDIGLMSPATSLGHSVRGDKFSAQDSESFTVLPPLIEPHSNVRLCVVNDQ